MPFIKTRTNQAISKEQQQSLTKAMGKAIEAIPGKSEQWLMLEFEGDRCMAFAGTEAPCAMVSVNVYGASTASAYEALTQKITSILSQELEIPENRIYIAYQETENWGWGGHNF